MRSADSFFRSHDGLCIRYAVHPSRFTEKAGSIVLLGGRREFIEKHAETIAELNARRLDVYAMDWRGQGLSGRELPNRHKGYVRSYDDYLDDLNRFFEQIVGPRAAAPCVILAHSMGGHIALRYLHNRPGDFAKAVLTAPMVDIFSSAIKGWLLRIFVGRAVAAGLGSRYVIGSGNYRPAKEKFEGNRLTSDPRRFRDEREAIALNPALAIGGPTYGWLKASLESIDVLRAGGYPESIRTPVLIVAAGADRVVSLKAQQTLCERLPQGRIRILPEACHEVLKESDAVRRAFWRAFDRFMILPCLSCPDDGFRQPVGKPADSWTL